MRNEFLKIDEKDEQDYYHPGVREFMLRNDLMRREGEEDIEYCMRVMQVIGKVIKYNGDSYYSMHNPAQQIIANGQTDCGGHSKLVSYILKANGVPCRK
jgi:Transglutaminase-like superfamily